MDQPSSTELHLTTTPTVIGPPRPSRTRLLGSRYRIRRLIGSGGMADVFVGDDVLLERSVAIKVLHKELAEDAAGLERFRREATSLAAVRSHNVVEIYDVGIERECPYLVMQYIAARTLEDDIAYTGPMSQPRAQIVIGQVLDGLAEMHAHGLIHRDIKPSNVLLDGADHVVLLDLGIVRDTRRPPLTAPGMIAGTLGYLPPESQERAECGFTSDVYQVGLLMLFLLTGVDSARRSPHRFHDLVDRLPLALGNVARCAVASDPMERFPSAASMRSALSAALDDRSVLRPTTEIAAAELLDLLSEAGRATSSTPTVVREARTTALQAVQIVSACADELHAQGSADSASPDASAREGAG